LRAWPLSGGAPRNLLGDLTATPFLLDHPRDSDDLLLVAWRDSHTPVYRVSPDDARVDLLPTGVESAGSVSKTDVSVSADGRRVAMVRSDGGRPDDLWVWDAAAGPRQLTDVNPWLRDKRLGRQSEIEWASFDGETIRGLLITPPSYEEGRRYPLVVNVHGGPTWLWTDHLHLNWHDWGMWLALQGYVVLLPNPRGSAGRGNRFARANVGDIGGGDYRDVMAGIDTLIDRGMVDADRMGIGGWSYGGTLTPWTLTQTDRFRCAVMGAGICNWVSFAGTCDIRVFGDRLFEAEQVTDVTALWERSALSRVANVRTPTLIVHGEQDHRVPVSQGREFYSALRHLGVPVEYVTYPREGHQVGERRHQRDLLARLRDWYAAYLG
ncbi:MAG: S9 family peptidase, partial [Chloroflexi bacterium]|nr:S9 family peptidase [Chloroflexota bacterium]